MTTELFPERLHRSAREEPNRTLVEILRATREGSSRQRCSAARWVDLARRIAAQLEASDLASGDRVLLSLPASPGFLGAFSGAHWIGAVPVPLPSLGALDRRGPYVARLSGVLRDCSPRAIVADGPTAAFLEQSKILDRSRVRLIRPDLAHDPTRSDPRPISSRDTAFIQYTSGSTGDPKGVVITHGNLAASCAAMTDAAQVSSTDRMVSWLPLFHDMGLMALMLLAWNRGWIALMDPIRFLSSPASWLHALSDCEATLTVAPNFAYSVTAARVSDAQLDGVDLSKIRLAFNGAEPIDPLTLESFDKRFQAVGFRPDAHFPVYGMAEVTIAATFPPPGRPPRVDHVDRESLAGGKATSSERGAGSVSLVSVGVALPRHSVEIHGVDGSVLPERSVGEIVLSGPAVSPGYFGAGAPNEPQAPLLTGDLGYLADGELYVVDRIKDLVIVAGRNYAPSDIETAADAVTGIRRGRVVACSSRRPEHGTDGLVILAEGRTALGRTRVRLADDVRRAVRESTGLDPEDVLILRPGTLPRTTSGKIQRRKAAELYRNGRLQRAQALAPMDPRRGLGWLRRLLRGFQTRAVRREPPRHGADPVREVE